MQVTDFYSPETLDEVLDTLAETKGRLIAGGTDVIPQMHDGRFEAEVLIDVGRLDALRFVDLKDGRITIGALTTYAEMINSPILQTSATALVEASSVVGSPQTRHRGTLGGNIANASPAGDTLPPLLIFDADVTLMSPKGERTIPLVDLLRGPGETVIASEEIIHHVSFEQLPQNSTSAFYRLGTRLGMAVSIASAAVALVRGKGDVVEDVRIALGAVAPTAIRSPKAEAILRGQSLSDELIHSAATTAANECSPIDDIRGTAKYRRHAVRQLVKRSIDRAAEGV